MSALNEELFMFFIFFFFVLHFMNYKILVSLSEFVICVKHENDGLHSLF